MKFRTASVRMPRKPGEPPRLDTEPVGLCDSRVLRTMMLQAWNPDAERDIRRGVYRDMFPGVPVVTVPAFGAIGEFANETGGPG